jgi:predicted CXXCH cytochrome family protein
LPPLLGLVLLLSVHPAHPAAAQYFGIRLSPHDFSRSDGAPEARDDFEAVCTFCHSPEGVSVVAAWDSTAPSSDYRMYSSATMDMPVASGPSPVSMACLSCHDGTVAGVVHESPRTVLGTDLRNDHPISVTYDPELDPAFRSAADVAQKGLRLFRSGGVETVECATCHNPHDNVTSPPFLRTDNRGSKLCLACHIK